MTGASQFNKFRPDFSLARRLHNLARMTTDPSEILEQLEQEDLRDYPRLHGKPQQLEYIALSMLVFVAAMASANAVHLRVGNLFVGGVLPMLKP